MKKLNHQKQVFTVLFAIGSAMMAIIFQNFTTLDTPLAIEKDKSALISELGDALKVAEEEHLAKQIALNVDPEQIEKKLKHGRKPSTISDDPDYENKQKTDSPSLAEIKN